MTRKTSEFAAATVITGAEFLIRQSGNKRLPLAVLDAHITSLAGGGGGSSSNLTAVVAADIGVTELALVDALSFTVEANKVYKIHGGLFYRTTAVSKGISMGFGGTAGVQSISARYSAFDTAGSLVSKFLRAKNVAAVFPTSVFAGDDNFMEVAGTVFTTAAGTFTIQFGAAVQYDYTAIQKGSGASLEPLGTVTV